MHNREYDFLFNQISRVLVVVAHPDDEVLGCGGTLARMAEIGMTVRIIIVSEGETARAVTGNEVITARKAAAVNAAKVLGVESPIFLDFPDQKLDTISLVYLTQRLERIAADFSPELVITHSHTDLNADHRIVSDITATAFRPLPGGSCRAFWSFETPSTTEIGSLYSPMPFVPSIFVDISRWEGAKLAALECYVTESRTAPHPRSNTAITALATWRGATCGQNKSEAFHVHYIRT